LSLLERLIGGPRLYNAVQILCGLRYTQSRLRPLVADTEGDIVLDLGGGTGLVRPLLRRPRGYVWLDNDPLKLRALPADVRRLAVIGDASRLCFRDRSVDVALCLALSHHLTDAELEGLIRELRRVVRRRLVFLDALDVPRRLLSRLLWKIDRGSHPRGRDTLRGVIERDFVIEHLDEYVVYHRYMLCTATPR
jgi:SAM-dependent methyltransferase